MHNLLEILIFTLRNFTKLPILRYLGICNVLYMWHIRAIPTYRVYRLYDIYIYIFIYLCVILQGNDSMRMLGMYYHCEIM